jgi:hypothetical protein
MKVKYNNIVGGLVPEASAGSCTHCCFGQELDCIPYSVWQCVDTIFEESKSQVLEL